MEVEIIAIRKDNGNHLNPHEAVSHYKWRDPQGQVGLSDRPAMVAWLKQPSRYAYVTSGYNNVYCEVRRRGSTEFLQTVSDGTPTNNLLQLPPC